MVRDPSCARPIRTWPNFVVFTSDIVRYIIGIYFVSAKTYYISIIIVLSVTPYKIIYQSGIAVTAIQKNRDTQKIKKLYILSYTFSEKLLI